MKEQNRHYYHDIGSGPHAGPLLNIPNQPRYQEGFSFDNISIEMKLFQLKWILDNFPLG